MIAQKRAETIEPIAFQTDRDGAGGPLSTKSELDQFRPAHHLADLLRRQHLKTIRRERLNDSATDLQGVRDEIA